METYDPRDPRGIYKFNKQHINQGGDHYQPITAKSVE